MQGSLHGFGASSVLVLVLVAWAFLRVRAGLLRRRHRRNLIAGLWQMGPGVSRRRRGHLLRRMVRRVRRPRRTLSAEYQAYINSAAWRKVRRLALERAQHCCEHRGLLGRCRTRRGLQVHHRHYRMFGREWDGVSSHGESVQVLCRAHHARADARRRRRGG